MSRGAYPKVRAVTAPDLDAEVIFDFNERGQWFDRDTLRDGWTLGSPTRLSEAGDARTAWGPRRPSFQMRWRGPRAAATKAQSTLARWLLQPEGWVLFQLDAMTPPVWLHMIGAEPQDLSFDLVDRTGAWDLWDISVSFDADPFLYGERVTLFDGTVLNDPTVAGGMVAPLGDVPGDAPMPLRVDVRHATEVAWKPYMLSYHLYSMFPNGAVVVNVGAGDGATDVHSQVTTTTDSMHSDGKARRLGFASTSGPSAAADQFTIQLPDPLPHGTYRVLVHGFALGGLDAFMAVKVNHAGMTNSTPGTEIHWNSGAQYWIDCGEIVHPKSGVVSATTVGSEPVSLTLRAGRRSDNDRGLSVDSIMLVPVARPNAEPTRTLNAARTLSDFAANSNSVTFDASTEEVWVETPGGTVLGSYRSVLGGWPTARPGVESTLMIAHQVVDGPVAETTGGLSDFAYIESDVTVSGHPQWLYLPSEEV